ncbi:MAG: lipopolysaccharide heptosyltransferase II, partial [Candidatus Aminicenantes bacterium]|nr:lipopolysaccharide heptosyltransferase II [Candidatus Aminicenantes bacterium]
WIGDSVLARPAVESIAGHFSGGEVWVSAADWVKDLFSADSGIAGVLPLPPVKDVKSLQAAARQLKKGDFDTGILLTNSFGSALLFYLAGIPERWGYSTDGRKPLLTKAVRRMNADSPRHQVHYYLDLVSRLGVTTGPPELRLSVPPEEKERARQRLLGLSIDPQQPLVILSPGASYGPAKRWPASRFARLAALFQERDAAAVLIIGSAGEAGIASDIVTSLDKKPAVLTGRTTLLQLLGLISLASLFVSNDTGPMHLANALHVPVVAIFGPTNPEVTGPFERPAAVLKKDVPCWPCLYRTCPYDHRCMTQIDPEEVYRAARNLERS